MIEISFVIPAYNVEKYIERCLFSIYNQDSDESLYEVIVVDDGSTDNTVDVLYKYQTEHKNFQVASQTNQGVSAARNHGLTLAKGEYLWFVDSDDYIVDGAISFLCGIVEKDEIDILFFNCLVEKTDGSRHKALLQPVKKNVILSGEAALKQGFYPSSSCDALWKRSYLENLGLTFKVGISYGEDSLFVFSAILQSKSVKFINEEFYIYCIREGSATTTRYNKEKLLIAKYSDIVVIKSIRDLYLRYENINPSLAGLAQKQYKSILFGLLYSLFRNRRAWKKDGISQAVIERLKENQLYPLKAPFYSWKKGMMSILLNIETMMS